MIRLELRAFSDLVADQIAAVQGSAVRLINSGVGSTLRAMLEANAGVAAWIQWLLAEGLNGARLTTASGANVDSFVQDYGLTRVPAGFASGAVTFSRFVPSGPALVPVGALVKTRDDSRTFIVVANSSHPAWDASLNGYVMANGVASLSGVPVTATVAGTGGNIVAAAVDALASTVQGVDTVTNPQAFSGGTEAESDADLKARFIRFIASLSRGTRAAIENAISSVRPGLRWYVAENEDPSGTFRPGFFTVRVDDGTGSPSPTLIAQVSAAVDAVRAFTVSYAVLPPTLTTVNVSLSISVASGYDKAALLAPVQQAVTAYINSLGIGGTVSASRVAWAAYGVDSQAVTNVSLISLNGGPGDVTAPEGGILRPGIVVVS